MLALSSCESEPHTTTREYESKEVLTFGGEKKNLIVENMNGSIDITGADDSQDISVRIIRRASGTDSSDAQTHIEDVKVTREQAGEDVVFKTDQPDDQSRNYSVSYVITVPRYFNIRLRQSSGDINVRGVENSSIQIENGNGEIRIDDVRSGHIESTNGNGGITADFWPAENSIAEFETGNGDMKISIPANSNTSIDASTDHGNIGHEGLPWIKSSPFKTQFTGVLGTGKSVLKCKVGNGNITLRSNGNQFEVSQTK
ncbi:MAG TPA: DUF4097 family beta strand repeat-containing protein [Patescibacteria group bacterium]|nr:DUF4097 family beta strand repeat-containing protein [Patescibacteria group bacterium]